MKKKKQRKVSIARCTSRQVLQIHRDNMSVGDFWMLVDVGGTGDVHIHEQPEGESTKKEIAIPRKLFNRLIAWYTRPQLLKPRRFE